jgi:hypothetical protein
LPFIRGEGLIPRGSAAVIKVLNPRPIPYENNIPRRTGGRSSAARLLIAVLTGRGIVRFSCFNADNVKTALVLLNRCTGRER